MKTAALLFILCIATTSLHSQNTNRAAQDSIILQVKNPISVAKQNETIELSSTFIKKAFPNRNAASISVKDLQTDAGLLCQGVDSDLDGTIDYFLFQSNFGPNEVREFTIKIADSVNPPKTKVYAAYMDGEEGMQDFTWENDYIGYRFYGRERAKQQGTGIAMDVWCKRLPELLTDRWYAPNQNYHEDKGYGADHYSSGKNQGCGGTGLYKNGTVHFSKAFSKYRIIVNGPIRVIFELEFTDWALNNPVIETKRVTLDAGNYFNKITSSYNVSITSLGYKHAVGFVQRADSETSTKQNPATIVSWESLGTEKGHLGTALIAIGTDDVKFENINQHITALLGTPSTNKITYYTGAAWDEYGQIKSKENWLSYVNQIALSLQNPCLISIKN